MIKRYPNSYPSILSCLGQHEDDFRTQRQAKKWPTLRHTRRQRVGGLIKFRQPEILKTGNLASYPR
ncbi:unnamed protein product [Prunus armeniaca]